MADRPSVETERTVTWLEFCQWLAARRVIQTNDRDWDGYVELVFDDGTRAHIASQKTDPTAGYSEVTPGSDGHLTTPSVTIYEKATPCRL